MLKIWQEEKLLIKYYLIKHLTLTNLRLTNEFGLSLMIYKFFDEKSGEAINDENQQLPGQQSSFKGNIWGFDLADIQLIGKYNKGCQFLLCVIDIYFKYASSER